MSADDRHTVKLSTGRSFYAYAGILGLDAEAEDLRYGYDGTAGDPEGGPLTPAERAEIATLMVERWTRWGRIAAPAAAEPDTVALVRGLIDAIHAEFCTGELQTCSYCAEAATWLRAHGAL